MASKKFTILVEGDSWCRLPKIGITLPTVGSSDSDIGRSLKELGHTVANLAYWGDTMAGIVRDRQYADALEAPDRPEFDAFILGGAGNDLLGNGRLYKHLRLFSPGRKPVEYLRPSFTALLATIEDHYEHVIEDVNEIEEKAGMPSLPILTYCYDYAVAQPKGYWIGNSFDRQGLVLPERKADRAALVKEMIDRLYAIQRRLARRYANFHVVNTRGTVKNRWHDELHPTGAAFLDVAKKMAAGIRRVA